MVVVVVHDETGKSGTRICTSFEWKLFQVQIFGHQTDCASVFFLSFYIIFCCCWFNKHQGSKTWSSSLIFELVIEVWLLRNFTSTYICYPKGWIISQLNEFRRFHPMPTQSDTSIDSHLKWIKLKKRWNNMYIVHGHSKVPGCLGKSVRNLIKCVRIYLFKHKKFCRKLVHS